ncbi:MAG: hypothetical protein LBS60_04510 [Deltaproteobacteria bacterium]|jgi:hypothetical protein|nr:hypothetical protein [Deltaproteobacteria bacterium]
MALEGFRRRWRKGRGLNKRPLVEVEESLAGEREWAEVKAGVEKMAGEVLAARKMAKYG